ncbi:MAG: peptidylprolyl isomerase [Bacteroidales bacterium]|nr:peptidylprolyl isomerase [Bacteroidales bacterium]
MRIRLFLGALLFTVVATGAPMGDVKKDGKPVLRIGKEDVTYGEFRHMYDQNSQTAITPISEEEYLDLFLTYKLKVKEARELGIDTTEAYRDERKQFVDELQNTYLVDTTAFDIVKKRLQSRMSEEIHAKHILVGVRPNATPADTMAAYKKAEAALRRVSSGEDFEKVAREVSEDPSAKTNGGDLGFFGALMMVSQFEDYAYNTQKGLTPIFRTRFGYHFMKVEERRAWEGEVLTRHIMKRFGRGAALDEEQAKRAIDSLYTALRSGKDFAEVARENSDDTQSAQRGGELPWIRRQQILPEYADAAFALKVKGDYSKPIRTRVGWHIVQLIDKRNVLPEKDIEMVLGQMKRQSPMYRDLEKSTRMSKLAKEYNFSWTQRDSVVKIMLEATKEQDRVKRLSALAAVATYNGVSISGKELGEKHLKAWNAQELPGDNMNSMRNSILAEYEKTQLASKYEDYRYTEREYSEGLLVYEVSSKNIWNVMPDSVEIAKQYNSNIARYSTGGTFEGTLYFCATKKIADKVRKAIAKGKKAEAEKMAYKVVAQTLYQGGNYDDLIWPVVSENEYVVKDGVVKNGTPKTIAESRSAIIVDLQQKAEAAYAKKLREKYKPQVKIKF